MKLTVKILSAGEGSVIFCEGEDMTRNGHRIELWKCENSAC